MIEKLAKGARIARNRGWRELVGRAFNYYLEDVYDNSIRGHFPVVPVGYNGVNVLAYRVSDVIMPENNPYSRPSYETAICRQLRQLNLTGNEVCILGAGWGVTSVVAAHQTGPGGRIVSYEASSEYVSRAKRTAALNECGDRITVRHGCVGPAINVYGEETDAPDAPIAELPDSDCYVIDIEGAELAVLDGLAHRPKHLLVESHGLYGSPTDEVKNKIREMGYSITSCEVAESEANIKEQCEKKDVYVTTAIR